MNDLKTTNRLLLFIVIPLVFYVLKILSFIFVPLILSMFVALLFLPLIRWLNKKRFPRFAGILIVMLIIFGILKLGSFLIKVSGKEITSADTGFYETLKLKAVTLLKATEDFLGIEPIAGENVISNYLQNNDILGNFGKTLDFVGDTLTMTLMTFFFIIILLSGSINIGKIMQDTLFKLKYSSVKTYRKIEQSAMKFVIVKFIISILTGLGISLACVVFDLKFPVFWGLFAFIVNFVQLLGSVLTIILLTLFAFIQIDSSSMLLLFVFVITAVQVIFGGIMEPIFMGKTFSLNLMTVLIMLMLWGFIWNIAGLILAIPVTVFIKIILEQFPKTVFIAKIMSQPERKNPIIRRRIKP